MGPLVHFGGEEQSVTPKTLSHGPFQGLLLIAKEQKLSKLFRYRRFGVTSPFGTSGVRFLMLQGGKKSLKCFLQIKTLRCLPLRQDPEGFRDP